MAGTFYQVDLGSDNIYCFKDLVVQLLEKFKDDTRNVRSEFLPIFENGIDCDIDLLKSALRNISRITEPHIRDLIKLLMLQKLVAKSDGDFIDESYYPMVLEVIKRIKDINNYHVQFLIDILSLKEMNHVEQDESNIMRIIKAYNFWCNVKEALGNTYSIETELISMQCPIVTYLYKQCHIKTHENVKRIIELMNEAEENGADLSGFRETFKIFVGNWNFAGNLNPAFPLDEIDAKPDRKKVTIIQFQEEEPQIIGHEVKPKDIVSDPTLFDNIQIIDAISVKNDTVKVKVHKCRCPRFDFFVAVKEIIAPSENDLVPFKREAKCLQDLSGTSENFLKFYGQKLSQITIGNALRFKFEIMMEYVERSLKDDKIERFGSGKPYTQDEIKHIYDQLVESFNIMRQRQILHCDIKPSNILVTGDLTLKIIDFNIARVDWSDATMVMGAYGTVNYMAPEIRRGKESDSNASIKEDKADVFSLGMTILFLVMEKNEVDLNTDANENKLKAIIEGLPYEWLKKGLKVMLEFDYRKRASLQDLIRAHVSETTSATMEI